MTNLTITHPDWRPRSGEDRMDRAVHLTGEAAAAYQVWVTIYSNRTEAEATGEQIDDLRGVNQGGLARAAATDTVLGTLLREALADATTRPVRTGNRENNLATYEAATRIRDHYRELVPPPQPLVPAGYHDETCQHGRSFRDTCDECGV